MTDTALIRDVTEATFERDVVEASRQRPVVVDFWAPWCGPCHQLSPLVEAAAARHAGDVAVAKLDVDQAPAIARRFGVQGIPAVKAYRDGRVVSEFVGVQPPDVVERFFAALAPSAVDRLVARAADTQGEGREALLREALEAQPDHAGAVVALAEILAARGEAEQARGLLARVPAADAVKRLLARLALGEGPADADMAALRARADAGDAEARLELGRALAARGEHDEALALLVAAVRDPATRDAARAAVLDVFAVLGDDPTVRTWRPRLASALF